MDHRALCTAIRQAGASFIPLSPFSAASIALKFFMTKAKVTKRSR